MEVEGECFVAAAAGEHHTLVVNQYGDVSTFGRGREGQLGHGEESRLDTVDVPRKVRKIVCLSFSLSSTAVVKKKKKGVVEVMLTFSFVSQ